jgi:hypothetical protein
MPEVPFSPDSQVPGTFDWETSRDMGNHQFSKPLRPSYRDQVSADFPAGLCGWMQHHLFPGGVETSTLIETPPHILKVAPAGPRGAVGSNTRVTSKSRSIQMKFPHLFRNRRVAGTDKRPTVRRLESSKLQVDRSTAPCLWRHGRAKPAAVPGRATTNQYPRCLAELQSVLSRQCHQHSSRKGQQRVRHSLPSSQQKQCAAHRVKSLRPQARYCRRRNQFVDRLVTRQVQVAVLHRQCVGCKSVFSDYCHRRPPHRRHSTYPNQLQKRFSGGLVTSEGNTVLRQPELAWLAPWY